jgi:OOP family OmpA-OmpF porin
MHIKQEGASVIGCYELHGGTVDGGIEGRVVKLAWHEKVEEQSEGAAFLVFSSDGQRWAGLFSYKGEDPNRGRFWTGTKRGSDPGSCPNWAGGIEQQMIKDIEEFGRARVYGINFDSDSDRIREESRPTLDHVAAMLKARSQWKITIEGHTDSTASSQHNQDLSERRANAVRLYLENAAIAAARLSAVGYGASRPVASNETALGRAQNRRVELVKQ